MSSTRSPYDDDDFAAWLAEQAAHGATKIELLEERRRGRSVDALFEDKPSVSAREIAQALNISIRTVKRHIQSGDLPSYAVGGARRVLTRNLLAWLHGVPAEPEPGDEILTINQAAVEAGVHPDTIRRWLRAGNLSFWRTGTRGAIRIARHNLMATIHHRARTETYNQAQRQR